MKTVKFKAFKGRNIYAHKCCIRLDLDLEDSEEVYRKQFNSFNERLVTLVPELATHRCVSGERLGFVRSICDGTSLNHICGHMALALQNMVGIHVSFSTNSKKSEGVCYTAYEYKFEKTGIEAGKTAVDVINSLIYNTDFDLESAMNRLKETLEQEIPEISVPDPGEEARVRNITGDFPLVAVTGTNGKTTTTRLIGYMLAKAGHKVGMTTTGGIYINGECVFEGDTTGPFSAKTVLMDKNLDAAVLETARGGIIRDGLAYDLADVAVITNITDDHLGIDGVETMEELAKVKALVGEAVRPEGYVVVNGDDPFSLTVVDRFKSKLIVFSKDKGNEVLKNNIAEGGYGIYTDEGYIFIQKGDISVPLIKVEDIAITFKGALTYNIENALAACSAAVGLGIDYYLIRDSLVNFKCDEKLNPGRFNTFDINGVTAILDYGHNIDGYRVVLEGLKRMNFNRLIGVIGVPGDRLDRNVLDVGYISGKYFNNIFIKEDKDKRGRAAGEIAEILRQGVLSSNLNENKISIILSEEEAFSAALDSALPGDAVIVFFEDYEPLVHIVKSRIDSVETTKEYMNALTV